MEQSSTFSKSERKVEKENELQKKYVRSRRLARSESLLVKNFP